MDTDTKRRLTRIGLGGLFIAAGALQATHREFFRALIPKPVQQYENQVQGVMTGVLAGIGASFLIPRLHAVGRWAAVLMLGGTLPFAVDQVRHPEQTDELGLPRRIVMLRIPMQMLVIAAAWWATRTSARRP